MGALRRLLGLEKGILSAGWDAGVDYDGRYVDVPVMTPTGNLTTAWSNGVTIMDPGVPLSSYSPVNAEAVWRTQPNVRKVIDFISRNVASIPLHLYDRVDDNDRRRITDGPLAQLLRQPQPYVTPLRFWRAVISDGLLFDRWAVLKVPTLDGGLHLQRIPARRFVFNINAMDEVDGIRVFDQEAPGGYRDVPLEMVIFSHGYSPTGAGLTPMQTLADILAESSEAVRYRRQIWKNGARVPVWIEVPIEASDNGFDEARFEAEWRSRFTGTGPDAGGSPMLKDGIQLHPIEAFNAQDMQDIEGRRLTAIEVASSYHIAPELVGAQQGNYSNVREYRQMLYRDSLGPYIQEWEQAINVSLVDDLAGDRLLYVEANLDAKLRGSFEERAQITSTAVGAPWLTRNEARALDNRAPVDGGDDLVTPLNVIIGGLASPRDTAPKERGTWLVKANDEVAERMRTGYAAEIGKYVQRQQSAIMSALGAKSSVPITDVWDKDRWDRELTAITFKRMRQAAVTRGGEVADALGTDLDEDVMLPWLMEAAKSSASGWNAKTLEGLEAAGRQADWKEAMAHTFELAALSRAAYLAATTSTDAGNFGANDVAKRSGMTVKTWIVTSGNPRSSHAAMNGETVPVGETFSNGARWPGDAVLPEEERANCRCEIEFSHQEEDS